MTTSTPTSDLFFGLTPERVLAAVDASGLRTNPVCYPLNSFENRVYEVELVDRSRAIVKFYRPGRWSADQILEEHAFLADLAAEEVPVGTVRPFPDGSTLREMDGIWYAISDRRGGRAPDELDEPLLRRLGRLVARVHNVGARRAAVARPRLDADRYVRRNLAWLREHDALPRATRDRYLDAAEAIAEIADRRMAGVPVHRVHADLHLGNVLLRDGVLTLLDFDDFVTGPAVQDLWLVLPGRGADAERQRAALLEGYRELRELDGSTLDLIEPLRALRMIRYAAWIARRWNDPAFRIGWPQFAEPDFWRRETEDLEEQLAVIRGEAGPALDRARRDVGATEPAIELTNKDYFWDWEGD
ncbi:MAG TPA: serine/threonine protein kinase [Thermoanaerobaculia bacterium]|nr:serine/threonine protein kinase [Thermoanaerobaculia bacterium]